MGVSAKEGGEGMNETHAHPIVTKSANRSSRSRTEMKGSEGGSSNAARVEVSVSEAERGMLHTDEKQEGGLRR